MVAIAQNPQQLDYVLIPNPTDCVMIDLIR